MHRRVVATLSAVVLLLSPVGSTPEPCDGGAHSAAESAAASSATTPERAAHIGHGAHAPVDSPAPDSAPPPAACCGEWHTCVGGAALVSLDTHEVADNGNGATDGVLRSLLDSVPATPEPPPPRDPASAA